jgi:hypothetical protein
MLRRVWPDNGPTRGNDVVTKTATVSPIARLESFEPTPGELDVVIETASQRGEPARANGASCTDERWPNSFSRWRRWSTGDRRLSST